MGAGLDDRSVRPMRDHMLVEPVHETLLSIEANIITVEKRMAPTCRARVIRLGPTSGDPGFGEGDLLLIVPQGGIILPMDKDHPERMVIPVDGDHVLGQLLED
jgi:hypothetical protein